MLAESADACAMVTFRSAASASTRQRTSLRKPAGLGPVASTRSRIATGPGMAPRLTSSNACAGFEAAWCWLLQVDFQEYRRERARSVWKHVILGLATGCRFNSRMDSRCFSGAEIDIVGAGQPHHLCRAHGHSRAYVGCHGACNACPCAVEKIIGLARSASPTLRGLLERVSSGVGQARGHSIRIRGKRADVWSPHTVLGRGVPCRGIAASSHGLGCE
jgi:hypothetical protein